MPIATHAIATQVSTYLGTNGTITVDACDGGVGDLHYQWYKKDANGNWQPYSTDKNLTNLSAGYYYGTVTDSSTPPQMGFFGAEGAPLGPLFNQPPQASGMFVLISGTGANRTFTIVDGTTASLIPVLPNAGRLIPIPQEYFTAAKNYMNGEIVKEVNDALIEWIFEQ